jgi:hypothetical protein
VLLLVALPVGWYLPRLLGLPAAGRLAGTLRMLPLVVAGFLVVERVAVAAGARRQPRRLLVMEATALAGWLLMVAARPRLGISLPAAIVVAALFALLGAHLATLLPRLRPLLGRTLPARPSSIFFAVPLLTYLAILPWSTAERPPDGDEPYYLLVAHSLAWDLDAELTDNYARGDSLAFLPRRLEPQPGDPVGRGASATRATTCCCRWRSPCPIGWPARGVPSSPWRCWPPPSPGARCGSPVTTAPTVPAEC